MKIKIVEATELIVLINSLKNQKMPIKIAFKFNNLAIAIKAHHDFYIEKLNEIIQEYGEKNQEGNLILTEDGAGYKIQEGLETECQEKIKELSDLEVELPEDITFTLDELDNLEVTLQEMGPLSKIITT